jgi:hypothetical protein
LGTKSPFFLNLRCTIKLTLVPFREVDTTRFFLSFFEFNTSPAFLPFTKHVTSQAALARPQREGRMVAVFKDTTSNIAKHDQTKRSIYAVWKPAQKLYNAVWNPAQKLLCMSTFGNCSMINVWNSAQRQLFSLPSLHSNFALEFRLTETCPPYRASASCLTTLCNLTRRLQGSNAWFFPKSANTDRAGRKPPEWLAKRITESLTDTESTGEQGRQKNTRTAAKGGCWSFANMESTGWGRGRRKPT